MKDNMKQLLDVLCNFDADVQVNDTYGKLEKIGEDCYWLHPKRGEGFALEGEKLEHLKLFGAVSLFVDLTELTYNKCMKTDKFLQKYGITPEIVEDFKSMAKNMARLFGIPEKQVFADLMTQHVKKKMNEK